MGRSCLLGLLVLLAAAVPALAELSNLDRLLSRMNVSTPGPPPTTPAPPHRVRHNHDRHSLQEMDYELSDEDDEEDEEPLADYHRIPFSTLNRPDWKGLTRKSIGKYGTIHSLHSTSSVLRTGPEEAKAQSEALNHLRKMHREYGCRVPMPKIVRVSDHYPDSSGTYFPSCTKLHVCAEDTGCCGPTQKCGPKASHKVEIYFYVTADMGRGMTTKRIEKLAFYNHTECSCQDRVDEMPRDTEPRSALDTNKITDQPLRYKCRCPSEYTVRNLSNGSCTCDCFDKQRDCTKYKKGRENFNHQDRLCIEMGKCTLPACDFGVYNRRLGRCPRKHEKFRSWARYKL